MVNEKLLNILRCPVEGDALLPDESGTKLVSDKGREYAVKSGVPVMLAERVVEKNDFDYARHYALDAELFDYFEEKKGGTEHDERRVREFILNKISSDEKLILDAGCGKAWVAKELRTKKELIVSLDISLENPKRAMELYPSENHAAVVADAFHLPFAENTFDCIVSSEVIEHSKNPKGMIAELFRVIKPSGKLIITTPYKEKIKYSLCIHCNRMTPVNSHLQSFDEIRLEEYAGKMNADFEWATFGNKALMHLRLHVILKYMPFWLWRLKDKFANMLLNRPAHIIAIFKKRNK